MSGKNSKIIVAVIAIVLVLLIAVGIVTLRNHHSKSSSSAAASGCVTQTLGEGSSGDCVKDAKIMVDYIETSGLNECPFPNGKVLADSDAFDTATTQQVRSVQTWTNCYNKQEGSSERLQVSGTIDSATWGTLCSYGYKFAKQSQSNNSQYRSITITAGKSAGCK